MENQENRFISVSYILYTDDGEMKEFGEEATKEAPFQFISGLGITLKAFEDQVKDLKVGDKFDFTIGMNDAYGPYDQAQTITLPKSVFEIDGKFDDEHIQEGAIVPLMSQDGQHFSASVTAVKEKDVDLDLNHPLAGCDLQFIGEVIENRTATTQELEQAAAMLAGEGGCSCGHCSGDCEGGCEGGCGHCH